MTKFITLVSSVALCTLATPALAAPSEAEVGALISRLDRLEADNARLKAEMEQLRSQAPSAPAPAPAAAAAQNETSGDQGGQRGTIGLDAAYSDAILDHTQGVNQRRIIQLEARSVGDLDEVLTLSGQVIAIGDAHWSNRPNKFGYLMRHPTGNNQRTKATQEIALNSAQIALTFTPTPDITGYVELLYDPEQSFGAGTITALARNQVQVRKAYVMWGNLKKSPLYVAAGKMDVPFGLQDTVSPFTNSSNWHAFAPLAYGGELGYYRDGLSLRAMAVVGGAQFRGANTPVDGTAVPSKLNNFAVDGSYRMGFGDGNSVMLGASYLHGSAYCQDYPVTHFSPCNQRVPAWAAYGRVNLGQFELIGDFATTSKVWPGTHVPDPANPLSTFAASKVSSYTVGGRYTLGGKDSNTRFSLEYSKFIAGPVDSPWHRQDQTVFGVARQFVPGVSLFGEFVRVAGYSPLNFISGGNFPDGSTWSDASARSQVIVTGIKAGF